MKISVIIAVYNEEKHIQKCLLSLINQTRGGFEIIVVDDGSEDSSRFKIQKAKLQFKIENLRIFHQKHKGAAEARNFGVRKSRGEILVFVDGDMTFEKDFLEKLTSPIIKGEAKGSCSIEELTANWDNCWARCWNYNSGLEDRRKINFNREDQLKDFRAVLKKEFLKVGGFDRTGYTDTWTLSDKLGYLPKPIKAKYYHYNPSTLKEVFNQAKWVAKRKYKMGKIGEILALLRSSPVFSLLIGLKKAL